MAFIRYAHDWDWPAAKSEFERAIELNPGYAMAHLWYGLYMLVVGEKNQSLVVTHRALELDPLSIPINAHLVYILVHVGRIDEAIEQSKKTLEIESNVFIPHLHLMIAFWKKDAFEDAKNEAIETMTLWGFSEIAQPIERGYMEGGFTKAMQALAEELEAQSNLRFVSPYLIAVFYALAEQEDEAIEWLEKAYLEHSPDMPLIRSDAKLDNIRADPRFQDFRRRMNFPE